MKIPNMKILNRSNVIQYDEMGYPLRLCIIDYKNRTDQIWIDTTEQEGDVVLQWQEGEKSSEL